MMSVKLTRNGAGLDAGEPRLLFRFPPGAGKMDMTHDGQRVLVVVPAASAQRLFAHVILNWTSLLKR
jgi:hypothetical protein